MKFLVLFLLSFSVFAQVSCDFDAESCVGDVELKVPANLDTPTDCSLDDPACPLPELEGYVEDLGDTSKVEKATYFLCFSGNRWSKKYGIGFHQSRIISAARAYKSCFVASGIRGPLCSRPVCYIQNL